MTINHEFSITTICDIVKGKLVQMAQADLIKNLLIDSRKIDDTKSGLFFCIKGDRNDGHKFIPELYLKGIRHFIITENVAIQNFPHANFVLVEDAIMALQNIVAYYRSQFNYPVIGITGSNGKTVVKEWLAQLLGHHFRVIASPKSFNSQVGVPLSVWEMNESHDLGIFEAGISLPNEMRNLQKVIQPTIGIFTNIGDAHSENFANIEDKVIEKMQLFTKVAALIYCKDYPVIDEHAKLLSEARGTELFTWSRKSQADLMISRIENFGSGQKIKAVYQNQFIEISIPFSDEASLENAIHCWALLLFLQFNMELAAHKIMMLQPVEMRLELKEGLNNCTIINDSYNSDFGSLSIAIDYLSQQQQHNQRVLILSDILQSGKTNIELYTAVNKLLEKKKVNKLIGIGESISQSKKCFTIPAEFYNNTEDFIAQYDFNKFRDQSILLKGARIFSFEKISKILQQKAHETVLEINLNAVVHNLHYFRSKLAENVKTMCMVKAFSYGSGSFEIANILQFNRADYLAVAYADEGVELRKGGIKLPIMVMKPEEQSFDLMIKNKLEPEIFNFRILYQFVEFLKTQSQKYLPWPIHLEIDTGMNRLGFEAEEINDLIDYLKRNQYVQIKSVFSHLVASDEAEHDEFSRFQIKNFNENSTKIVDAFQYPIMRHICNSGGIIRFPEAHFDMVRLGIGLYGIGIDFKEQNKLQPVSTLKTTISQIRIVRAGETIGYSRRGKAEHDMEIATIPIGYADGLLRKFGNGRGHVLIKGILMPTIGNICMDLCMIDVTGKGIKEGDEVVVFGKQNPIQNLAKTLETIPYEVLTGISRRVKRIYYQE